MVGAFDRNKGFDTFPLPDKGIACDPQNRPFQMTSEWYEVWVDDGLPVPHVLIVFPDKVLTGAIIVIDPKEKDKVVHNATDYENAKMWLLEDEFERVEGRMIRPERPGF